MVGFLSLPGYALEGQLPYFPLVIMEWHQLLLPSEHLCAVVTSPASTGKWCWL